MLPPSSCICDLITQESSLMSTEVTKGFLFTVLRTQTLSPGYVLIFLGTIV